VCAILRFLRFAPLVILVIGIHIAERMDGQAGLGLYLHSATVGEGAIIMRVGTAILGSGD